MFNSLPGTGLTDSWAEAWRRRQGIDQWPLVEAKVIRVKYIPADEGPAEYKLTLRYYPPNDPGTTWEKSLTVTKGTTLATSEVGDTIPIRCHPLDPDRIAQQDTTQLAYDIRSLIFISAMGIFFLIMFLTHHLHWESSGD